MLPSGPVVFTSPNENVPRLVHKAISPMSMPKSPTRLTINALFAAVLALCRSK
jgi:hypothetical protein